MKQNDFILIGVVVFVSVVASVLISQFFFSSSGKHQQTAEVVDVITAQFDQPPKEDFNASSVNPTQLITIGESNNPNPFNNKSQ